MNHELIAVGVVAVAILASLLYRRIRKRGRYKVPQGLQVWDENGNIILDTDDMLGKVLGVRAINAASGSITDARLTEGQPFYAFYTSEPAQWFGEGPMRVSISGSTISWSAWSRFSSAFLAYGVF